MKEPFYDVPAFIEFLVIRTRVGATVPGRDHRYPTRRDDLLSERIRVVGLIAYHRLIAIPLNQGKIYEYELFAMHEPPIELVSPMSHVWKHLGQFKKDWSRPFQILIPMVILSLLIFALLQKG